MKTRKLKMRRLFGEIIEIEKRMPQNDIRVSFDLGDGYDSYLNFSKEEALYLADSIQHLLGNNPLLKPIKTNDK